jgi:hypothetical protein
MRRAELQSQCPLWVISGQTVPGQKPDFGFVGSLFA